MLCSPRPIAGSVDPWVTQAVCDLKLLHQKVAVCSRLPQPNSALEGGWFDLISSPMWTTYVRSLHFTGSVLDRVDLSPEVSPDFVCIVCGEGFASHKSMAAHVRTKHRGHESARVPQRFYAFEGGECRICGTNFNSRFRLLRHLCDSRRTRCWDALRASSIEPIAEAEVSRLDDTDKVARREAKKSGHSHPIAKGAAIARDGRQIGYVR